ncbi:WD40 repeat-like protein [Trichoderma barbatum]
MDGLPTSLNTLGVEETSVHTAWALYKYVNDVKNAKSDIKELGTEVNAHLCILEKVKDLLESQSGRLKVSQELRSALDTNYSKLASIKRHLDEELAVQTSRRKQIWNILRWPSRRRSVESEVKKLRQSREDIRMALEIDQAKLTTDIRNAQSDEILATLPVVEGAAFDAHANEHEPKCHPGTRVKILEVIGKWAQDPDGRRIYWLNGMAGTGKSTICRTVAHHLASLRITTASFFFKKGDGNRDKAGALFTTIIKQLIEHLPEEMVRHVKQALQDNPGISDKSLSKQFEGLLLEPMKKCKSLPPVIVVVLDALDECDDQANAAKIIELLPGVANISSTCFKVLVASRPECHLRESFAQLDCDYDEIYLQAALHEVADGDVRHDISVFLKSQLEKIKNKYNLTHLPLPPEWPSESLVKDLVNVSMPLFILAATACRFIGDEDLGVPVTLAQEFLQHRQLVGSSHLARTYLPILEQLLVKRNGVEKQDRSKAEKEKIIKDFRRIVGTIVLLEAPLSTMSLSKLLRMDLWEIDSRLSSLHSVLNVPKDFNSQVKLFHLSFRDFLTDARDQNEKHDFLVDERETHANLARQCIELLMMDNNLKQDICELVYPGTLRSDINQGIIDAHFPPHVRYACIYWVFHLKNGGDHIHDDDETYGFLTKHLIHWLEALSLLGLIAESFDMVDSLLSMVDDNSRISSLLRDVERFIRTFRHVMDIAPLQIYSSALLFAPKTCVLRQCFEEAVPKWIKRQPTVPMDWDSCLSILEHDQTVCRAVFSPDSSLTASTTASNVYIWQSQTGTCVHEFDVCSKAIAFSSDSKLFHVVSDYGRVEAWETDAWTRTMIVERETEMYSTASENTMVWSAAISLDCKLFAVAFDKGIQIRSVSTQNLLKSIEMNTFNVNHLMFSQDSAYLLAQSSLFSLCSTWPVGNGQKALIEGCWGIAYSPDSSLMALGCKEAIEIHRIGMRSLTPLQKFPFRNEVGMGGLTFSHDAALLAICFGRQIEIWLTDTGKCIWSVNAHTNSVKSLSFSHDSTLLVSSSSDRTLHIYNISKHRSAEIPVRQHGSDRSIMFSPDSSLILSKPYRENDTIWQILRADSGVCLVEFDRDKLQSEPIFTHDSKLTMLKDGTAEIWHADKPQHAQNLEGLGSDPSSTVAACFSADLTLAAGVMRDGSLRIWQMDTGACVRRVKCTLPDEKFVKSVILRFSPDASRIAFCALDTDWFLVWQVESDAPAQKFEKWRYANIFAFSNTKLAAHLTGDQITSRKISIWSLETGDVLLKLCANSATIKMLTFSCDSALLALARDCSGEVEIWNADTGAHVHNINLGVAIAYLSFEPNNSGLRTNLSRIKFRESALGTDKVDNSQLQPWYYDGLGYENDDQNDKSSWITFNGKRLLWLPAEYRGSFSAVSESVFATVPTDGHGALIEFDIGRLLKMDHNAQ